MLYSRKFCPPWSPSLDNGSKNKMHTLIKKSSYVYRLVIVTLRQIGVAWGREPQLRDCLHIFGDIFLISDQCGALWTVLCLVKGPWAV